MRVDTKTPQSYKYRVIIDGVDLTASDKACLFAASDEPTVDPCGRVQGGYCELLIIDPRPTPSGYPMYVLARRDDGEVVPATYKIYGDVKITFDAGIPDRTPLTLEDEP